MSRLIIPVNGPKSDRSQYTQAPKTPHHDLTGGTTTDSLSRESESEPLGGQFSPGDDIDLDRAASVSPISHLTALATSQTNLISPNQHTQLRGFR